MRRLGWPFTTVLLALSACNAISGASDLSICGTTCDEPSSLVDASVDVQAALPESGVREDSGGTRDAALDADASVDAKPDVDAGPGVGCDGAIACTRVIFATSASYTGDLGGIAGADAKCQALADKSSLARVKGRTFVAWVSTTVSAASSRLVHGTMPYLRTDGATVASSWTDLTDNALQNAISLDENANNRTGAGAWTATNSNGATYAGFDCLGWTPGGAKGVTGNVGGSGNGWSSNTLEDCMTTHALYCVEK